MASRTNLRLAEIIRQRAAHVILFELKDPRMGFVTITRAKLSADLATATIYWSVLGGDAEKSKTTHALEHARVFVQRRVAEGLRTRVAPEVVFAYDESVEGAIRMGSILKQLRHDRGDDAAGESAPADAATPSEGDVDAGDEVEDEDEAEDDGAEEDEDEPDDDDSSDDEPSDGPKGSAS
jgi:ribosome-binding factor A